MTGSASGLMDSVEAAVMEKTAKGLGIPEADMAVDAYSTNTYENLVDVKEYMEKNGLRSCLLVTSPAHMLRASLVARKLGLECSPAPVGDYTRLRRSGIDRIALAREAAHEYAGILFYRIKGYL